jgi:iron complex transport system ATP-binding protein
MSNTVISAENITFGYSNEFRLLEDFNFTLAAGEFAGLIGPSGAGKTTIFRLMSGFVKPRSGRIKLKDHELNSYPVNERSRIMAVVPQTMLSPLPYTVRQIVEMSRVTRVSRFSVLNSKDNQAVTRALEEMEVLQYENTLFNNLSGGEKQRVMIAMALAQEPEILLLDEPTASLDIGHCARLMKLLKQMNQERQMAVMIISHDIQLAARSCERLILIQEGRIIANGPPAEVLKPDLINQAYSCSTEIITDSQGRLLLSVS